MKTLLSFTLIATLFVVKATAQVETKASVVHTSDSATSAAEKNKISGTFEMNYLRHYLWRGMFFGNNDVAQPELNLTYKGFTLTLLQNYNYAPKNVPDYYTRNAVFDEQDVEISYEKNVGKFTTEFRAMAYFYFFQRGTPNTAEVYNKTSYNFYKGFSAFTENSYDVASYRGAIYSNSGITFEKSFKKILDIEWNGFAAFANEKFNQIYYYEATSGLNAIGSNIAITKNVGKFYFNAFAEKNYFLRKDVKQATGLNGTDNFSIAAGINF
jgi:hypothetical protein